MESVSGELGVARGRGQPERWLVFPSARSSPNQARLPLSRASLDFCLSRSSPPREGDDGEGDSGAPTALGRSPASCVCGSERPAEPGRAWLLQLRMQMDGTCHFS